MGEQSDHRSSTTLCAQEARGDQEGQYPAAMIVAAEQPRPVRKSRNSALICSSHRLTRNSTSWITFNTVPLVASGWGRILGRSQLWMQSWRR